MDQIQEQPEIKKREPKPEDIGTRYDHLLEYRDSLEACITILEGRMKSLPNQQRMVKFMIALEIANITLDAYSGFNKDNTEYTLYKLVNTVPKTKEELLAIGGEPLAETK